MTDTLDEQVTADDRVVIPDDLCEALLEASAANPSIGHVMFLRELGMPGTRGQIKAAVRAQLADDLAAVRGDTIRREIAKRAIEGELEDVWWQGEVVGQKVVKSDRLLEFMGRTYLPEARDQVEITGAGGGPVRVEVEGGRVSTLSGVFALAAQLGVKGAPAGLERAAARGALPAASPVRPDPPVDQ